MNYKFRAWDKKDKRMIVDEQRFVPLIVTNKGVMKLDPQSITNKYFLVEDNNRFELMASTGLVDMQGKEIYKSDLLIDEENFIWEVVFKQGAFYAECSDLMAIQLLSSINLYTEIIGNIYETEIF